MKNLLTPAGIESATFRFVVQHLNHCATAVPRNKYRVIRNDCLGFNNLLVWPPRSPDATPRDFFLCGYVKDQVYVPPLPARIPKLKVRIRTTI